MDTRGHKSYPSIIESSERAKSTRRKDARKRKEVRKVELIAKLRAEVADMQAVKRKEFQDKLAHIQKVTGQDRLAFEVSHCCTSGP